LIANGSIDFFNYRLLRDGLRPVEVGGGGICFLKVLGLGLGLGSHQLYGDSSHHLEIGTADVQYLRANPERFIESSLNKSWIEYLSNMTIQGTWANFHIIISTRCGRFIESKDPH